MESLLEDRKSPGLPGSWPEDTAGDLPASAAESHAPIQLTSTRSAESRSMSFQVQGCFVSGIVGKLPMFAVCSTVRMCVYKRTRHKLEKCLFIWSTGPLGWQQH